MNFAERCEDLRIWQEARGQVRAIYRAFQRGSAGHTDVGFWDQLQRAAVSVMNNIAEGFERKTPKDFAHFLDLAKGSCGGPEHALCCRRPGLSCSTGRSELARQCGKIIAWYRVLHWPPAIMNVVTFPPSDVCTFSLALR